MFLGQINSSKRCSEREKYCRIPIRVWPSFFLFKYVFESKRVFEGTYLLRSLNQFDPSSKMTLFGPNMMQKGRWCRFVATRPKRWIIWMGCSYLATLKGSMQKKLREIPICTSSLKPCSGLMCTVVDGEKIPIRV